MSIKGLFLGPVVCFYVPFSLTTLPQMSCEIYVWCKKHIKDNLSPHFVHTWHDQSHDSCDFQWLWEASVDPSPSPPSIFLSSKAPPIQWFDRRPHLSVNYPIKIYEAGEAFTIRRAADVSWHHHGRDDWSSRSGCILFSATPEQGRN